MMTGYDYLLLAISTVAVVVNVLAFVAARRANRAAQENLSIMRQLNEERARLAKESK